MDEVLIANFMIFQDAVEEGEYDLVIADEAWDIDHYWHEHPELKKAELAWFTDFVGYVPMPSGGEHEAFLSTDYNAEMIGHVERHPEVRDRAIFVGNPRTSSPLVRADLPAMRDWVPRHFDFAGYILGEHPRSSANARHCGTARLSGGGARLHRHGRRLGRRRHLIGASCRATPCPRPIARIAHDRGGRSAYRPAIAQYTARCRSACLRAGPDPTSRRAIWRSFRAA